MLIPFQGLSCFGFGYGSEIPVELIYFNVILLSIFINVRGFLAAFLKMDRKNKH